MDDALTLTVEDVKRHLHIGNDKVYTLFRQKSFPSFKVDGKYLVRRDEFEKWLDNIQKLPDRNYKFEH